MQKPRAEPETTEMPRAEIRETGGGSPSLSDAEPHQVDLLEP